MPPDLLLCPSTTVVLDVPSYIRRFVQEQSGCHQHRLAQAIPSCKGPAKDAGAIRPAHKLTALTEHHPQGAFQHKDSSCG